jgi:hypothetical protein
MAHGRKQCDEVGHSLRKMKLLLVYPLFFFSIFQNEPIHQNLDLLLLQFSNLKELSHPYLLKPGKSKIYS